MGQVFSTMDAMGFYRQMLNQLAVDHKTDLSVPYKDLPIDFKMSYCMELVVASSSTHIPASLAVYLI